MQPSVVITPSFDRLFSVPLVVFGACPVFLSFQDMMQVSSQRLTEFDTQGIINFLSAVVVMSEEGTEGGCQMFHDFRFRLKNPLKGGMHDLTLSGPTPTF